MGQLKPEFREGHCIWPLASAEEVQALTQKTIPSTRVIVCKGLPISPEQSDFCVLEQQLNIATFQCAVHISLKLCSCW